AGWAAAQEQAIQMAARQGRISFLGGLPKDEPIISLDANLVHYRELTIVGANGSSPAHNKEALALIASGSVLVADLITHTLPLDSALDALGLVSRGEAIKVTIEANGVGPPTSPRSSLPAVSPQASEHHEYRHPL